MADKMLNNPNSVLLQLICLIRKYFTNSYIPIDNEQKLMEQKLCELKYNLIQASFYGKAELTSLN